MEQKSFSNKNCFELGMCWLSPAHASFLKLILCGSSVCMFLCVCMCVCVCQGLDILPTKFQSCNGHWLKNNCWHRFRLLCSVHHFCDKLLDLSLQMPIYCLGLFWLYICSLDWYMPWSGLHYHHKCCNNHCCTSVMYNTSNANLRQPVDGAQI